MTTSLDNTYAVVVVYYRRGPDFALTLSDILGQTRPAAQVIVIDNSSNDSVIQRLRAEMPQITIITPSRNLGYAGGMNAGAARVSDSVKEILFVTHEVRMGPETVQRLQDVRQANSAVLVGPGLALDAERTWSYGGTISRWGTFGHLATAIGSASDVDWLDGACLLSDRLMFDEIGGFDESYFLYWEDVDFGIRAANRGRVICASDVVVRQSTGTAPSYFRSRNSIILWKKNRLLPMLFLCVAANLARVLRDLSRGRPGWKRAGAGWLGIRHGISGKLSTDPARWG